MDLRDYSDDSSDSMTSVIFAIRLVIRCLGTTLNSGI